LRDQLDEEGFRRRVKDNVQLLDALAAQIVERAREQCPSVDVESLAALLGASGAARDSLLFADAA
jgi:hypothetical protein